MFSFSVPHFPSHYRHPTSSQLSHRAPILCPHSLVKGCQFSCWRLFQRFLSANGEHSDNSVVATLLSLNFLSCHLRLFTPAGPGSDLKSQAMRSVTPRSSTQFATHQNLVQVGPMGGSCSTETVGSFKFRVQVRVRVSGLLWKNNPRCPVPVSLWAYRPAARLGSPVTS